MNDNMHNGMSDATQFTREGKLREATALIQRTLGGLTREHEADVRVVDAWPMQDLTSLPGSRSNRRIEPKRYVPTDVQATIERTLHGLLSQSSHAGVDAGVPVLVPPTPAPDTSGQFVAGSCTCAAGTRSYRLYIPSSYRGHSMPLIVLLHGCTQDPIDLARGTRMNEWAEWDGFLVLYPEQSTNANGQRCWNWFKVADQGRESGEPAILASMTRQIMTTYAIDADRVYVAGMSAGGSMAAIMGATYPDLYAAVGVHSGLPYRSAHDLPSAFVAMRSGAKGQFPSSAVPTIIFHGSADTTVHSANADGFLGRSPDGETVSRETGRVAGGHAYTHSVYRDRECDVEQWIVRGAGHAWSGGSPAGSFTDAKGPDASAEMARFFHEHPHRR
jgi:poly(hydroxyalkanoate) depolymerase family esterase